MSKQNLTRIVGIWSVILFISFRSHAQDLSLTIDTPVTVSIGEAPAWLSYEGTAGETIILSTMTAITDTAPDTTLEILYPDGHRLDYADDVVLPDGTVQSDATLQVELPVEGRYQIRVDSFNGVSEGDVEILLTQPTQSADVSSADTETIIRSNLSQVFTYSLDVTTDSALTITAHDLSGTLDPVLWVFDADGTLLAFNDDHQSDDLTLNVFDARIDNLNIDFNTVIEIVVRDYLGREGSIKVVISS